VDVEKDMYRRQEGKSRLERLQLPYNTPYITYTALGLDLI